MSKETKGWKNVAGSAAGGFAGSMVGAKGGATLGLLVGGPLGAAIGAPVGALVGMISGGRLGYEGPEKAALIALGTVAMPGDAGGGGDSRA